MIIRGQWLRGRAWFRAVLALSDGNRIPLWLQADTAATHTVIAGNVIPSAYARGRRVKAPPIRTLLGYVPSFLLPGTDMFLVDSHDRRVFHRVNATVIQFVEGIRLGCMQRRAFRKVLNVAGDVWEPPRNLLGQDVLSRFILVAREPDLLFLTDDPEFHEVALDLAR